MNEFTLNGVTFKHYHARDSHGFQVDSFYVDSKFVTVYQFRAELARLVKPFESELLIALGASCHYTPNWDRHDRTTC
jgi:hypothetical protein